MVLTLQYRLIKYIVLEKDQSRSAEQFNKQILLNYRK